MLYITHPGQRNLRKGCFIVLLLVDQLPFSGQINTGILTFVMSTLLGFPSLTIRHTKHIMLGFDDHKRREYKSLGSNTMQPDKFVSVTFNSIT